MEDSFPKWLVKIAEERAKSLANSYARPSSDADDPLSNPWDWSMGSKEEFRPALFSALNRDLSIRAADDSVVPRGLMTHRPVVMSPVVTYSLEVRLEGYFISLYVEWGSAHNNSIVRWSPVSVYSRPTADTTKIVRPEGTTEKKYISSGELQWQCPDSVLELRELVSRSIAVKPKRTYTRKPKATPVQEEE